MRPPFRSGPKTRLEKTIEYILIAVVLAVSGWSMHVRNMNSMTPARSDGLREAPEFSLSDQKGNAVSLGASPFKDSTVIVHFWASWCAPCLPEMEDIFSFIQGGSAPGVTWILVTEDETFEKALAVVGAKLPMDHVILVRDQSARVSDEYGTYKFPETYLLTATHGIAAKWIGPQDWMKNGAAMIQNALAHPGANRAQRGASG